MIIQVVNLVRVVSGALPRYLPRCSTRCLDTVIAGRTRYRLVCQKAHAEADCSNL
jgi:hypothetical protein